ncbi:hypothetical protein A9Q98_14875 [Thalassotalea sp. 42_200_T64]|nr:hypothetical protein A9Q98_14875 [Thalassotalea sp. 42_200_T64]
MKKLTISNGVEVYLTDCDAREQSPRTIEGKASSLKCFLAFCLACGIKWLIEVNEELLEKYRLYIRNYQNPRTNKKITQATRRNKLTHVKGFCERVHRLKYLKNNPAIFFELPKRPRVLTKAILSKGDLDKMFKQTDGFGDKGIRDRAIMELFWATGARSFELAGMTLDCINWEEGTIRIEKGKGRKDRIIPLGKRAEKAVKKYLKTVRTSYLSFESGNTLFLNDRGEIFTYRQLGTLVTYYKLRAGVNKPKACMLFRHTCATMLINGGAGLFHVKEILGHEDISTTQAYVHLAIDDLKQVYNKSHPAAKG